MTDKELLELAAKAAGMSGMWFANTAPDSPMFFHQPGKSVYGVWNPLTDDGDALRLAVKLNLCVVIEPQCGLVYATAPGWRAGIEQEEKIDEDPYAATRRAIVRAAAEIGKTK